MNQSTGDINLYTAYGRSPWVQRMCWTDWMPRMDVTFFFSLLAIPVPEVAWPHKEHCDTCVRFQRTDHPSVNLQTRRVLADHAISRFGLPKPDVSQTQALPKCLIATLQSPASSFLRLAIHVAMAQIHFQPPKMYMVTRQLYRSLRCPHEHLHLCRSIDRVCNVFMALKRAVARSARWLVPRVS